MNSINKYLLFLIIALIFIPGGCGDSINSYKPYKAYQKATEDNTIEAYEEFIKNYPDHPYVRLANNRIEAIRTLDAYRNSFGNTGIIKKSTSDNP